MKIQTEINEDNKKMLMCLAPKSKSTRLRTLKKNTSRPNLHVIRDPRDVVVSCISPP